MTLAATAALLLPGTVAYAADVVWTTVNTDSTGDQDNASVSSVRTGYTAVVWEDDRDSSAPGDPAHSDVWIRLYLDGVSQYEKKLSAGGTGTWRHVQPDVALHEDGSAVVVWSEDPDGNGFYNIALRTVSPSGVVAGSGTANASATGQQYYPAVAADPDSPGFAVTWEDKQDTTNPTVRVAGFASLTSKSYEAQVNGAGGTHQRPDVAVGAAGNAIVVWDEDGDANGAFNVARKILTPAGGVKLAQGVVNATTGGQQRHASVAANFNGDFAVAWETGAQVGVRSFTYLGAASSTVDTVLPGADPQVGIDDQRNAVVTSVETGDVVTQGLNADGTTAGRLPRQTTVRTAADRQDEPALGVDGWGLITVVYTDDNDGNQFDQVYLGSGWVNSTW